jgi:hypothetical protein
MPNLVESDFAVQTRANFYYAVLAAFGGNCHLFTNNVVPDPSFTDASFTEASYPGYAAQPTTSNFGSPVQIVPGQWTTTSGNFTFPAPTSGGSVTIYGAYIDDSTPNLLVSMLFASPVVLAVGDPPLIVQFAYSFFARILLP